MAKIETGDSWMGGKYCDLHINGKKYVGRGETKEEAIRDDELESHFDNKSLIKPPKGLAE